MNKHSLAGKSVRIISGHFKGETYRIEDWFHSVVGKTWMEANGNMAATEYAIRIRLDELPLDNQVLYGKIGQMGKAVHASEIGEAINV